MRIHIVIASFFIVCLAITVDSSIENSPASSKVGVSSNLKGLDDLYIDDEGDDEIQLGDEASGSGPLNKSTRVEEDEDEDEEEEEEEEDEDDTPVVVVEKPKETVPAVNPSSSADYKEDEVVAPPKVSPVAAPPSRANPPVDIDDDDDEDDEDFEVQGSGEGSGTGRVVSGGSSVTDDEEEEDYEDSDDVESIDINSVITEPETPVKPERKPEVVVVAPPTTPVKPTKESDVGPSPSPPPIQPPTTTSTTSSTSPPEVVSTTATSPVDDVHIHDHKAEDRQASFFAQPGILAAVIGGAVVGLLCAILLVMFIVYRMRKKDEGSYVLDEPKRSSPSSNPYNKNSREFYA